MARPGSGYTSTFNKYTYNDRGEVESVRRYRGDTATATPVAGDELPGRRFEYRYDQAGNRRSSGVTGDSNGAVDVSGSGDEDYTSNAGNQYLFRENNAVQVSGTVASEANAAAVGAATFERRDRAWGAAYVPANASAAAKGSATVYAAIPGSTPLVRAETKEYFVPKRAQEFGYDYAGNLTHDSVWDYAYDAENRLVAMQHRGEAIGSGKLDNADVRRLEFTYDYLGRRVQKIVRSGWNGSAFTTVASNRKYLYEGWNVVAEFDAASTLTLVRSYTWGLDTAGSFTATGGVGALLQIRDEAQNKTLLPTYDGNGNVAALVDADSGAIAAAYEYGPFGEPLRAEGTYAAANPFRFSTKFTDEETGLVYYGRRYYSSVLGRFITRDPIGEEGGVNLYGFVGNDGVNRIDLLGLRVRETNCRLYVEVTRVGTQIIRVTATRECDYINTGSEGTPSSSGGDGGGSGSENGTSGSSGNGEAPNKQETAEAREARKQRCAGLIAQMNQWSRDWSATTQLEMGPVQYFVPTRENPMSLSEWGGETWANVQNQAWGLLDAAVTFSNPASLAAQTAGYIASNTQAGGDLINGELGPGGVLLGGASAINQANAISVWAYGRPIVTGALRTAAKRSGYVGAAITVGSVLGEPTYHYFDRNHVNVRAYGGGGQKALDHLWKNFFQPTLNALGDAYSANQCSDFH